MVIDGHAHCFRDAESARKVKESFNVQYAIGFPMAGDGTHGDLAASMARAGVDYAVLANFAPLRIIDANNRFTLELGRRDPRYVPLVGFHPELPGDHGALIRDYAVLGARGVKLHPMAQGFDPRDPRLAVLYGACAELGLPVVFHVGPVSNARLNGFSDPEIVEGAIAPYANLKVLLTHFAGGRLATMERFAARFPEVRFDTSIVASGYPALLSVNEPSIRDDAELLRVIRAIGADRFLFGSDWPWGDQGKDLERFRGLGLWGKELDAVLSSNAAQFFSIN